MFSSKQMSAYPRYLRVCKLLHMNELEIAQWSLVKDASIDYDYGHDEELQLFLTAYHAKVQSAPPFQSALIAETEKQFYYAKVCDNVPSFAERYYAWRAVFQPQIVFNVLDLNAQFNIFRKVSAPIDS